MCVFVPLKAGITITFASFVSEREHSQVPVAAEVYPRDVNKDKPFTVNERFQQPLENNRSTGLQKLMKPSGGSAKMLNTRPRMVLFRWIDSFIKK